MSQTHMSQVSKRSILWQRHLCHRTCIRDAYYIGVFVFVFVCVCVCVCVSVRVCVCGWVGLLSVSLCLSVQPSGISGVCDMKYGFSLIHLFIVNSLVRGVICVVCVCSMFWSANICDGEC